MADSADALELDSRFPSGEWMGFYLQPSMGKSRHRMRLCLIFKGGSFDGEGKDSVWQFLIKGRYDLKSGEVTFHKHYVGMHSVYYRGFAEGKGIWGIWEIGHARRVVDKGGFHIWPKGVAEGSGKALAEEIAAAREAEKVVLVD